MLVHQRSFGSGRHASKLCTKHVQLEGRLKPMQYSQGHWMVQGLGFRVLALGGGRGSPW